VIFFKQILCKKSLDCSEKPEDHQVSDQKSIDIAKNH